MLSCRVKCNGSNSSEGLGCGLCNRQLLGRFSSLIVLGTMQTAHTCFSVFGSMFSRGSAVVGDGEEQVVLFGFGIIRSM